MAWQELINYSARLPKRASQQILEENIPLCAFYLETPEPDVGYQG
jgi:hypothetical protein